MTGSPQRFAWAGSGADFVRVVAAGVAGVFADFLAGGVAGIVAGGAAGAFSVFAGVLVLAGRGASA